MTSNTDRTIFTCPDHIMARFKAANGHGDELILARAAAYEWYKTIRHQLAMGDLLRMPHPIDGEPMIEIYYDGTPLAPY